MTIQSIMSNQSKILYDIQPSNNWTYNPTKHACPTNIKRFSTIKQVIIEPIIQSTVSSLYSIKLFTTFNQVIIKTDYNPMNHVQLV